MLQDSTAPRPAPAPVEPAPAPLAARPSVARRGRGARPASARAKRSIDRVLAIVRGLTVGRGLIAGLLLIALPGSAQVTADTATALPRLSSPAPVPATSGWAALPATAFPAAALPATALPATALPSTALPATALPASRLPAAGLPTSRTEPARGNAACLILPSRVAEIGSPAAGIVETVEVERGDTVARGAVLVRLQADVERARASVSRQRADSEAELRGAIAAEDLARQQHERSKALLADNFVSKQAVDQAAAEFRLASEKVAQARDALKVTVGESGVSAAQMAQRLIRAPFAGIVTERFAQPGERYEEKPLLRLAAIDELKVEVIAANRQFGLIRAGQVATIEPDLPGHPPRTARVVQVDQVLDPASNTFRVRLALPNPDRDLPAGLRCRASFDDSAAATPTSSVHATGSMAR